MHENEDTIFRKIPVLEVEINEKYVKSRGHFENQDGGHLQCN